MLRGRLIGHLFPAKVEKTLTITTVGLFTVSVGIPPKSYVGSSITLSAVWNATTIGPFSGTITWGDGTSETFETQAPKSLSRTHRYMDVGTYTARVDVFDEGTNMSGYGTNSITIAASLSVTFSVSPTSGDIPLAVTFTCGVSGGYPNYPWTLDPGDGSAPYSGTRTASGTWTQSHTYKKVGTFTAKLTVEDALGATVQGQVGIGAGVPILFPRLRERFPRLFERLDKLRQRIPTR